jgi:hypothetical protein
MRGGQSDNNQRIISPRAQLSLQIAANEGAVEALLEKQFALPGFDRFLDGRYKIQAILLKYPNAARRSG